MNWWNVIVDYYSTLGKKYHVDPIIFVGIHVVATPLFLFAGWWIFYNMRKKKSLVIPIIIATIIFNSANIYLVISGKNIPFWIYIILAITTIISSYFTFKKFKKKKSV